MIADARAVRSWRGKGIRSFRDDKAKRWAGSKQKPPSLTDGFSRTDKSRAVRLDRLDDLVRWAYQTSLASAYDAQEKTISQFRSYAKKWADETRFVSSVRDMVLNPSYLHIIGMGTPVVPLLLNELRHNPHDWFRALEAITGEDPAEGATSFQDAKRAWLDWGRQQGYLV